MKKQLIIYGSHYGTTKAYAEKLSERTGLPVSNYETITDLSDYEEIIHLGGLYAGGVKGLGRTLKALPQSASLILVTVGLADVTKKENTDHIKDAIRKQVPQNVLDRTTMFHLRGGIDYKRLNFLHKAMMAMVHKKLKSIPEGQRSAEDRDMLDTYKKRTDFVDFETLGELVAFLKRGCRM